MSKNETALLQRLDASATQGYLHIRSGDDKQMLMYYYTLMCKNRQLPMIAVHETGKGRARVVCMLLDGTTDLTFTSSVIRNRLEQIGLEVGLMDSDNALTTQDVKRSYAVYEKKMYTCSTLPTDRAIKFTQGIIELLSAALTPVQ